MYIVYQLVVTYCIVFAALILFANIFGALIADIPEWYAQLIGSMLVGLPLILLGVGLYAVWS